MIRSAQAIAALTGDLEVRWIVASELVCQSENRRVHCVGDGVFSGIAGQSYERAGNAKFVGQKIANYKRFRELSDEWVDWVPEREQLEREQAQ